jgi:hypothetical protein
MFHVNKIQGCESSPLDPTPIVKLPILVFGELLASDKDRDLLSKKEKKKPSCCCRLDLELTSRCLGINDLAMQIMKLHKVNIHDAKQLTPNATR